MLLKFGARNFFCFKEGIEISLKFGAGCPHKFSKGSSASSLLCVKGSNGSGKTNALKILSYMEYFCCNSFNAKPEDDIGIDSFFMIDEPTDLFCNFLIKGIEYHYNFSVSKTAVVSEKLSRKKERLTDVFERNGNKLTTCIKEYDELNSFKLRANASILSTAHQHEIACITPVYNFFRSIVSNIDRFGKSEFGTDYLSISEFYNKNPVVFEKAIKIIREFDLGIDDIEIFSHDSEDGKKLYFPMFTHDSMIKDNVLTYNSQSLGTQTLYRIIPFFITVLQYGGILVMDEFDTDLHPHMLQKIVELFDNEESNPHSSQMLFSTHNTDIIEYMGKYRTVFINKESSESYGYRLDEIPGDIIRNDRPIAPVYNSGKIGGVPRI